MITLIPSENIIEIPLYENIINFFTEEDSLFSNYRYFYSHNLKFPLIRDQWLSQFDSHSVKEQMLSLVLTNLIYISDRELQNQIYTYSKALDLFVSKENSIDKKSVIIVGLSDGARLDLVRSFSDQVMNYQILPDFRINREKAQTILKKMQATGGQSEVLKIILVDDFLGSGLSLLRKEQGVWKGKLIRVINELIPLFKDKFALCEICLSYYYASENGLNYLKRMIEMLLSDKRIHISMNIYGASIVPQARISDNQRIILEKQYRKMPITDVHYSLGGMEKPYLGFAASQLLLVFEHNTPNNSLPIIWQGPNALFPRKQRHTMFE